MEAARIREEETGMDLTENDLVRMGLTRKGKWQYTVADIEALPEGVRAELIDGELFVRMETPTVNHQDILMGLSFQIEAYIQRKKGSCHVYPAPLGVRIKKDIHNYVEPDITLICDSEKLDRKGCYGAPDLVIEIVSSSNRKMDYVRKLALYRETGVREYWIVDPKHRQVTVYEWEQSDQPALHPFSERIKVGVYDDLYLDLENLHGTLEEVLVDERQVSRAEGHAEGRAEGRAEGFVEGEARFAELTAFLLQAGRMDDLSRAAIDLEYRNELYRQMDGFGKRQM